jgi:hypothetical protein
MRNEIKITYAPFGAKAACVVIANLSHQIQRTQRRLRKSIESTNAMRHALGAECMARRLRNMGDIRAAEVWEHHAARCRRVGARIDFGGAPCTP